MTTYTQSSKRYSYLGSAVFVIAVFVLLFLLIMNEVSRTVVISFDEFVISAVQSLISPRITTFMLVITELGSVKMITTFVIISSLLLVIKKKFLLALFVITSSGMGALLNLWLKWIFKRERPDILPLISEKGYSFPSGHTMGSFIFYGALAYIIIHLVHQKNLQWLSAFLGVGLIVSIGLSRIYLGVHYPSDIVGGFLAGAAWLLFTIILFRYYEYYRNL
jgi:membrane-associated phospholipid phosphatase